LQYTNSFPEKFGFFEIEPLCTEPLKYVNKHYQLAVIHSDRELLVFVSKVVLEKDRKASLQLLLGIVSFK